MANHLLTSLDKDHMKTYLERLSAATKSMHIKKLPPLIHVRLDQQLTVWSEMSCRLLAELQERQNLSRSLVLDRTGRWISDPDSQGC